MDGWVDAWMDGWMDIEAIYLKALYHLHDPKLLEETNYVMFPELTVTPNLNSITHRLLSQDPSAVGASRMALQVKVLTAKPVGLSLITGMCTM